MKGLTQIPPLRWLRPTPPSHVCLRCGAAFEEPAHTLCRHCRQAPTDPYEDLETKENTE